MINIVLTITKKLYDEDDQYSDIRAALGEAETIGEKMDTIIEWVMEDTEDAIGPGSGASWKITINGDQYEHSTDWFFRVADERDKWQARAETVRRERDELEATGAALAHNLAAAQARIAELAAQLAAATWRPVVNLPADTDPQQVFLVWNGMGAWTARAEVIKEFAAEIVGEPGRRGLRVGYTGQIERHWHGVGYDCDVEILDVTHYMDIPVPGPA